jgi:hypothetical protein
MALLTRIGLAGFPQRSLATRTLRTLKFWRIPSNAPNGTSARAIVFNAGNPAATVSAEGAVTADASGNFDLTVNDAAAAGAKRMAVVHDWNGNTGTNNIKGGPAIATMNEIPL